MTETKKNNIINNITEEIYQQISKKFTEHKKESGLIRDQIYASDVALVSRVEHNKRVAKKNQYLLTPTFADEIVANEKLKFSSTYELVWGKKNIEDNEVLFDLFKAGFAYLELDQTKIVNEALYDHLNYASAKANYEEIGALNKSNKPLYEFEKSNAIGLFIKKHQNDLIKLHYDYFKDKITTKLDKNILTFYNTYLLNYLEQNQSQFGVSFYNQTKQIFIFERQILDELWSEINKDMILNGDSLGGLANDKESETVEACKKLKDSAEAYINTVLENENLFKYALSNKRQN